MSGTTTEVVYLKLKPGLDLSAGKTKEDWEALLSTIKKQPGAKKLVWGRQIEHPDIVQIVEGTCLSLPCSDATTHC